MSPVYAALTFLGVIVATAGSVWVAQLSNRASPYAVLAERTMRLERDVPRLRARLAITEADLDVLAGDLLAQHRWQEEGSMPPPPAIRPSTMAVLQRHREERFKILTDESLEDAKE